MSRLSPVLFLLVACADEPLPISDRDMDGDCLTDNVEIGLGTNPWDPDTDGDGYWDGDEAHEGSDPVDADDWIYEGGWPYWGDKDVLGWPEADGPLVLGEPMFRFTARDQFGDRVDLYDFAGAHQEHTWIVLDVVTEWCGVNRVHSEWLTGGADSYGLEEDYGAVRKAVRQGEVAWITVVTQDTSGAPAGQDAVDRYAEDFPHRRIPVLADKHSEVEAATIGATGGWPTHVLIRARDMKVVAMEVGVPGVLPELLEKLD